MSKIKQIQIGEDTFDLSVNASDIDGQVDSNIYLGELKDYNTQGTALDVTNLKKGSYTILSAMYDNSVTSNFYIKNTYNDTDYYYNVDFNSYNVPTSTPITMILTKDTKPSSYIAFYFPSINENNKAIGTWEAILYIRNTGEIIFDKNKSSILTGLLNTSNEQTVYAKKTFNVLPESSVVPTTDNQLVNKKYVDDNAGGIADSIHYEYNNVLTHVYFVTDEFVYRNLSTTDPKNVFMNCYNHAVDYFSDGNNRIIIIDRYGNSCTWLGRKTTTGYQSIEFNITSNSYIGLAVIQAMLTKDTDGKITSFYYWQLSDTYSYLNGLGTTNTKTYTPTSDYNPATKKYVDDAISSAITDALGGDY